MMESVESLVQNYKATAAVHAVLKPIQTIMLTGITGAGKDTIIADILQESDDFEKLVTSTTRAPRTNNGVMEVDGHEYYFLSHDQAERKIRDGEYVELALVHEKIYGSLVAEYQRIAGLNKIALTHIDYQGAAEYLSFGMDKLRVYFITPPSFEIYMARLLKRQGGKIDDHEELLRRFRSAQKELQNALDNPAFIPIMNEDSRETARKIIAYAKDGTGPSEAERNHAYDVIKELGRSMSAYISQIEEN